MFRSRYVWEVFSAETNATLGIFTAERKAEDFASGKDLYIMRRLLDSTLIDDLDQRVQIRRIR